MKPLNSFGAYNAVYYPQCILIHFINNESCLIIMEMAYDCLGPQMDDFSFNSLQASILYYNPLQHGSTKAQHWLRQLTRADTCDLCTDTHAFTVIVHTQMGTHASNTNTHSGLRMHLHLLVCFSLYICCLPFYLFCQLPSFSVFISWLL